MRHPLRLAPAGLALLALVACNYNQGRPSNDPRYIRAVRDHYNANAAETDPEPGCQGPTLALLRDLQVVDSFPQGHTLRLFARFDFEQREPGTGNLVCAGVGERYFTLFKANTGPVVRSMSGPVRATPVVAAQ